MVLAIYRRRAGALHNLHVTCRSMIVMCLTLWTRAALQDTWLDVVRTPRSSRLPLKLCTIMSLPQALHAFPA